MQQLPIQQKLDARLGVLIANPKRRGVMHLKVEVMGQSQRYQIHRTAGIIYVMQESLPFVPTFHLSGQITFESFFSASQCDWVSFPYYDAFVRHRTTP